MSQSIFEISNNRKAPKYLQIVHSVTKSLKQGKLKSGDRLLSINEMSTEFRLARDTVQKAYGILEKDGLLVPVKGKGFYIGSTDTLQRKPVSGWSIQRDFSVEMIETIERVGPLLEKYKKLVFVRRQLPAYLVNIEPGLRRLCCEHNLSYSSVEGITSASRVLTNVVYLVVEETDLASLIRKCCARQLTPGIDLGIISLNDTPLKELLMDGITVISADHYKMVEIGTCETFHPGQHRNPNPFSLVIRKSL